MSYGDYSACGLRLIVRGDPKPGTYQVAVYCDLPHGHDGNHHACIDWDGGIARRIAQGSWDTSCSRLTVERDKLLRQAANANATCARVEKLLNYAADYEQSDFVDAIRVALYPIESKRWTVQATTNSELAVASLAEPS